MESLGPLAEDDQDIARKALGIRNMGKASPESWFPGNKLDFTITLGLGIILQPLV